MYLLIFAVLVLGALGVPIPEELAILVSGAATARGLMHLGPAFIVCFLGILAGDHIAYCFGRLLGRGAQAPGAQLPFASTFFGRRCRDAAAQLDQHLFWAIFGGRHIFFLRGATFVSAGLIRVSYWRFLAADLFAAACSVTVVLMLGRYAGQWVALTRLLEFVRRFDWAIFAALLAAAALTALYHYLRRPAAEASCRTPASMESSKCVPDR